MTSPAHSRWALLCHAEKYSRCFPGPGHCLCCGLVIPGKCFGVILWLTPSLLGQVAELVFRVGVAVVCRETIPGQSLGIITLDSKSTLVEVSNFFFGSGVMLVGRFAIPTKRLLVVTMNAVVRFK